MQLQRNSTNENETFILHYITICLFLCIFNMNKKMRNIQSVCRRNGVVDSILSEVKRGGYDYTSDSSKTGRIQSHHCYLNIAAFFFINATNSILYVSEKLKKQSLLLSVHSGSLKKPLKIISILFQNLIT